MTTNDTNGNTKFAIDKMSASFDKTIDTLKDFLKTLGDIVVRLEVAKNDHVNILEKLDMTADNSFKIVNIMEKVSNEEIMDILEGFKSDKGDLFTVLNDIHVKIEKIYEVKQSQNEYIHKIQDICRELEELKTPKETLYEQKQIIVSILEKVSATHKLYKYIAIFMIFLSTVVSGFELVKSIQNSDKNEKINKVIDKIGDLEKIEKSFSEKFPLQKIKK